MLSKPAAACAGEIPATFGRSRDLTALSNDPVTNATASLGHHTRACIFSTGLTLANNSFSGILPAGLQTRYLCSMHVSRVASSTLCTARAV